MRGAAIYKTKLAQGARLFLNGVFCLMSGSYFIARRQINKIRTQLKMMEALSNMAVFLVQTIESGYFLKIRRLPHVLPGFSI